MSSATASHASEPRVLVVAGPSGAGKSTLIRRALEGTERWLFSVSATTRPQREHEQDGVDYHFLSRAQFNAKVAAGEFLEYANVYGNLYGTLYSELDRAREAGRHLLIEIDSVGSLTIHALRPRYPRVAIVPPSFELLRDRLAGRETESEAEVSTRIENAWIELARMRMFDFAVVNDDLETAAAQFRTLLGLIEAGVADATGTIDRILNRRQEHIR